MLNERCLNAGKNNFYAKTKRKVPWINIHKILEDISNVYTGERYLEFGVGRKQVSVQLYGLLQIYTHLTGSTHFMCGYFVSIRVPQVVVAET